MLKILSILSLIIFSSASFTSQQNGHKPIPFTVFSSTGFTAPKNLDVLQEQGNMPKQAILEKQCLDLPIKTQATTESRGAKSEKQNLATALPKPAISKYTILKSDIRIFPPCENVFISLRGLIPEITRIHGEVGGLSSYTRRSVSARLIPTMQDLYRTIEVYKIQIKNKTFAGNSRPAATTDLYSIIRCLTEELINLSTLVLAIDFSNAIRLASELQSYLAPVSEEA